jgi:hypothetical protein
MMHSIRFNPYLLRNQALQRASGANRGLWAENPFLFFVILDRDVARIVQLNFCAMRCDAMRS